MKNALKISVSVLCCLLLISSCGRVQLAEKEDVSFWNSRVVDSSFALLYKDSDTTRALRYFDSVLSRSSDITVYPLASRFAIKANYHYFFSSDNKATAEMIDSALAIYRSADLHNQYPRTYVGLLLFGGHIAYRLTQYNKANEYYFKAEQMGEKHLDSCERAAFHYNIGMVLYRQRNYVESLNYFKEAYNLQNSCSPQTAAIILQQQEIQSNIGLCYVQLRKYDSAMLQFDKALEIAEQSRDSLGEITMEKIHGVIYGHKGKVALERNHLDTARQLCLQSIALCDREGYEPGFAQAVKLQLAEVYKKKKDTASMLAILKDVDSSTLNNNARLLMEWSGLMASYYEQTAQPNKALQLFRQNYLLRDSLANSQMILSAADVTRQLHDKEQQLQIASLKKDKELALVSLWVIIVFTCMVMVIIFLIYQNYKRSKKSLA
ncbi:MAG TPA: tetratricopeptide repeat protein, partial [Flavisolibacter sp.]